MKKTAISLLSIFLLAGIVAGAGLTGLLTSNSCVYKSSFTRTAEENAKIQAVYFKGVLITSSTTGGYIELFDAYGSTTTGAKLIGIIDLGAKGYYPYDINLTSGVTYNSVGNTNGLTIIFKK